MGVISFNIGNKVKIIDDSGDHSVGEVIDIYPGSDMYYLEFNNDSKNCEFGYYYRYELERIEDETRK